MSNEKGLTLMEVVIAMMIMAGTLVLLTNSWSANLLRVRRTNLNNTIGFLLQRQMTEMELKYKDVALDEIPEEGEEGDFGAAYKGYRWKMVAKPFQMPDISQALISKEGGADEMMLTVVRQVSENLSEAIKEMTVSVFVKVGNRESEYSATTYRVDFNKKLSFDGGGVPQDTSGGSGKGSTKDSGPGP